MFNVKKDGRSYEVYYTNNKLSNVVSEELSLFVDNSTFTGTYENPLIIWLHGRWEGGADLSDAILGNQVTSLAEDNIQSYFTSADGTTGAYVMPVQAPTCRLDNGIGEESEGDCCSRCTQILIDTILNYLQEK